VWASLAAYIATSAAQQGAGAIAVLGVQRDADARLDLEREAAGREGLLERAVHTIGGGGHGLGRGDTTEQHRELVPAQPGDGVALAHDRAQALADALDDDVAVEMAEGVVDLLEAVEVHQQDRNRAVAATRAQGVLQQTVEQRPVGEAGQRIAHRLVLGLGGLAAQARGRAHGRAQQAQAECREPDEQDQVQPPRVAGERGTDGLVGKVDAQRPGRTPALLTTRERHRRLDRLLPGALGDARRGRSSERGRARRRAGLLADRARPGRVDGPALAVDDRERPHRPVAKQRRERTVELAPGRGTPAARAPTHRRGQPLLADEALDDQRPALGVLQRPLAHRPGEALGQHHRQHEHGHEGHQRDLEVKGRAAEETLCHPTSHRPPAANP